MSETAHPDRFLPIDDVLARFGIGKTTLYSLMDRALFPRPVKIGPRVVRWSERELERWQAARFADRDATDAGADVIAIEQGEDDEAGPHDEATTGSRHPVKATIAGTPRKAHTGPSRKPS